MDVGMTLDHEGIFLSIRHEAYDAAGTGAATYAAVGYGSRGSGY